MKNKLLIVSPRIPGQFNNKKDIGPINLIKVLAQRFEVDLLYTHSIFDKDEAMKNMEGLGVRVISSKEIFSDKSTSFDMRLGNLFKNESYKIILFDSYYSAKYYLAFLGLVKTKTIIAIYVSHSQCYYNKDVNQAVFAGIHKFKELAVYNYADVIIVKDQHILNTVSNDLPNVSVIKIPEVTEKESSDAGFADKISEIFLSFNKKPSVDYSICGIDIVIIKTKKSGSFNRYESQLRENIGTVFKSIDFIVIENDKGISLLKRYVEALKSIKSEYGLILLEDVIISASSIQAMLFCANADKNNAIIVPNSNINIGLTVNETDYDIFLKKHYLANFGNWDEVKQIHSNVFLINKGLIDRIGLLDTRYASIYYGLFDYLLKAYQAGYKAIAVSESFVLHKNKIENENDCYEKDYKLCVKKWCDLSMEFIESLK